MLSAIVNTARPLPQAVLTVLLFAVSSVVKPLSFRSRELFIARFDP